MATLTVVTSIFSGLLGLLGFLISPIALVTIGLGGLLGYLLHTSGAGSQALRWLGEGFGELKERALSTFDGIKNALAAGEMKLAAQILWLGLRLEWIKGVAFLQNKWADVKDFMLRVWTEMTYKVAEIFINVVARLRQTWIDFVNGTIETWRGAQMLIAKGVGWIIAKIQGISPEDVMRTVEEDYVRQYAPELSRRREEGEVQKAAIETDRQTTLEVLEENKQRWHGKRGEAHQREIEEVARAIAEARKEWANAQGVAAAVAHKAHREAFERSQRRAEEEERTEEQISKKAGPFLATADAFGSAGAYKAIISREVDPSVAIHRDSNRQLHSIRQDMREIRDNTAFEGESIEEAGG